MALLSEKLESMDMARRTQARRFDDPGFHFVPRRKMMQIQACIFDHFADADVYVVALICFECRKAGGRRDVCTNRSVASVHGGLDLL